MSQKLPIGRFKWVEDMLVFNEKLKKSINITKNYNQESDIGYIFEVDIKYPKNLHDLYRHLPFLPERMKINRCSKLICNFYGKKNVVHLKSLKQALNYGLIVKKRIE